MAFRLTLPLRQNLVNLSTGTTQQITQSVSTCEPFLGTSKKQKTHLLPLRNQLGRMHVAKAMSAVGHGSIKPNIIKAEKLMKGYGTPSDPKLMQKAEPRISRKEEKRKQKEARWFKMTGCKPPSKNKREAVISPTSTASHALDQLLKSDSSSATKSSEMYCEALLGAIKTGGLLAGFSKKMTAAACIQMAGFTLNEEIIDAHSWYHHGIQADAVNTAFNKLLEHRDQLKGTVKLAGGSTRRLAPRRAFKVTKPKCDTEYASARARRVKWLLKVEARSSWSPLKKTTCA